MINYDKFFTFIRINNIKLKDLRKHKIVSEATLQKMRHNCTGLSYDSLNRLCAFLNCQPGDIMEYVEDDTTNQWLATIRESDDPQA